MTHAELENKLRKFLNDVGMQNFVIVLGHKTGEVQVLCKGDAMWQIGATKAFSDSAAARVLTIHQSRNGILDIEGGPSLS